MAKIKGLTIEIGADTKEFHKALGEVNKKSKDLAKELKEVEKGLKFNPKNTELLAQKQKLLGDQVANTKEKLGKLKDAEKQVQDQFKKGEIAEEQYRAFQREIVETESKLKNYEKQLKNVSQAQKNAGFDAEELGKKLQKVGDKLNAIGKEMTTKVTLPIAAAGAIAFKFAADIEDAMGASDQIFKGSSEAVKNWADNLAGYYGIAEGDALSYANTMGAMLQNIGGLSEAEAANQAQLLVELAGDLSAMFGGTTDSAVQALTGALKGNNAMLDNYGMGINDATIKQKAMEMGLYDGTKQMGLAEKQAATLALIMEQTADAQGQAGREANGASGSLKTMTTEVKNLAGDLGNVLIPIVLPFIQSLKDIVERFQQMSPQTQEMIVKMALFAAAIGPVLMVLGSVISTVGKLMPLFKLLGVAIAGISAPVAVAVGVGAALIAVAVAIYKNWDSLIEKAKAMGAAIAETFGKIKETIAKAFDFKFTWPKLTLPKFKITGSMNPLKWIEEGTPKLSVNWNAEGAIFTKPYIFGNQGVGEAGPEAVLPISKLAGMMADVMRKMGTQQQPALAGVTHNHTGVIRVEGVNNRGETMDVVNIVMDQLRREVRK